MVIVSSILVLQQVLLNGGVPNPNGMGHQSGNAMEEQQTPVSPPANVSGAASRGRGPGPAGKPRARRMDSSSDRLLKSILPHQSSLGEVGLSTNYTFHGTFPMSVDAKRSLALVIWRLSQPSFSTDTPYLPEPETQSNTHMFLVL